MRIACVQLLALGREDADRALEAAAAAAEEAARDADLVVLPEATYPGYILHDAAGIDEATYERGRTVFAQIASRNAAWVAVGLVRPTADGLANSGVLIDPAGAVARIVDKSFLWHFDSLWFRRGAPAEVAALPWGGVGMFVCADARMPEIPRRLALRGARLLLDPTALVRSPRGVNAQLEYMLRARAWENGAFLAVANKCGTEAGIASYGGRSAIYDPTGAVLAQAGSDAPEIVTADVDLDDAPGPPAAARQGDDPELAAPIETLPITEALAAPPPSDPFRLAMLAGSADPGRASAELDVDLVIGRGTTMDDRLLSVSDGTFSLGPQTLAPGEVLDHGAARIGLLAGPAGTAPEAARVLMLRGANVIVWDRAGVDVPDFVLRTRADENRLFLVTLGDGDRWQIHGPTGALLGEGPRDGLTAVYAELPLSLAWLKEMAPGTHIVRHRPVGELHMQ